MLLLAAVIAAQIELAPIAAACRVQILAHNPRHLVSRWPTIGQALPEEDFQSLVNRLSTRYGPERVEALVEQLGIEQHTQRSEYASDGEFAAALLNVEWNDLQNRFGSQSND